MSFDRALLPDPATYFDREGLNLIGRGKWRTTRCTFHGGSDSLRINVESGCWICMSCGAKGGDVLAYAMRAHELQFIDAARALGAWIDEDGKPAVRRVCHWPAKPLARPAATRQRTTLSDYGREILRACRPIHGIGRAYLESRRCLIPPEDSDLRFHPNLKHPSGYSGPALVGLVTDVLTRKPMTLHRTWITASGKKEGIGEPRMNLGGHQKQGGCIRLWPDEYVTHGLAVCEGIETCLSLAHAYQPVWCVIDAGNLAALPVLPGVECLLIGRDNDAAGIRAAAECAARWVAAGTEVQITNQSSNDLNDAIVEPEPEGAAA